MCAKKNKMGRIYSCICVVVVVFSLFMEPSCAEDYKLYRRDNHSPVAFTYVEYSNATVTLGIEKDICDPELAAGYLEQISNDLLSCWDFLNEVNPSKPTVYLLKERKGMRSSFSEDRAFLFMNDFASGDYRRVLTQLCVQSNEPWVGVGLAGNVFGAPIDHKSLSQYLIDSNNLRISELFGAYYYPDWLPAEDYQAACDAAVSFAAYVLESKGLHDLLNNITSQDKADWLKALHVDQDYEYLISTPQKDWVFSASDVYSIIIETENVTYNLKRMQIGLVTAYDVLEFVAFVEKDIQRLSAFLSGYDIYRQFDQQRAKERIYICIDESEDSGASLKGREITLSRISGYLSSLVDDFIPPLQTTREIWKYSGIGEYMSSIQFPNQYLKENRLTFFANSDYNQFTAAYTNAYQSMGGTFDNIDLGISLHAAAVLPIILPDLASEEHSYWPYDTISELQKGTYFEGQEGSELSHAQAGSFMAYLVEKYGFEVALDFCINDKTFEESYGCEYETEKQNWINFLLSKMQVEK